MQPGPTKLPPPRPRPSLADAAPAHGRLRPIPVDPSWILEGAPVASSCQLSDDGGKVIRICACTDGAIEWRHDADETIMILEGSAVIGSEDLEPRRFVPGDSIFFRAGARTKWRVEGYVKKIAFSRRPAGAVGPAARLINAAKRLFAAGRPASMQPIGGCGAEVSPIRR